MAIDPKIGYKVVATVTGSEGTCGAGHNIGDSFEIVVIILPVYVVGSIMIFFQVYRHFNLVGPYPGGMGILFICNVPTPAIS